ncbi:transcription elongation factor GreA [bacterium]|nr:transcription elongation factor GreA [bacterium]
MAEKVFLTPQGKDKILKKLKYLKEVRRPEIAERIKKARELGDLSENAEYHAAKDEQGWLESEILRLETILRKAEIIEPSKTEKIDLGSKVKVLFDGQEKLFSIVSQEEVDALKGAISHLSPLGQALVGHKKGDEFLFETPKGKIKIKILDVS